MYTSLQTDVRKITVATFLTEVISKCFHENDVNPDLFEFLDSSFKSFDKQQEHYSNFHVFFLFELAYFMGFHPQSFDELKMQLVTYKHSWHHVFDDDSLKFVFVSLLEGLHTIHIDRHQRSMIIDIMIDYYRLHIENFGEIKSLKVLREL